MRVINGITLYEPEEVAEKIGVCYRTILRWIKAKKLYATKIEKQYLISEENINLFLHGDYRR